MSYIGNHSQLLSGTAVKSKWLGWEALTELFVFLAVKRSAQMKNSDGFRFVDRDRDICRRFRTPRTVDAVKDLFDWPSAMYRRLDKLVSRNYLERISGQKQPGITKPKELYVSLWNDESESEAAA